MQSINYNHIKATSVELNRNKLENLFSFWVLLKQKEVEEMNTNIDND